MRELYQIYSTVFVRFITSRDIARFIAIVRVYVHCSMNSYRGFT